MLRRDTSDTLDSLLSRMPSLALMSLAVIGLTLSNALFNSLASSVGLGYPLSTFLFKPWDLFGDLFKVAVTYPGPPLNIGPELAPLFTPHTEAESGGISNLNATPLVSLMYMSVRHALTAIHPIGVLAIFVGSWTIPLGLLALTRCRNRLLSTALLCALLISYPTLFAITRGNLGAGLTSTALITALVFTYERKFPLLVATLIAVAVNMRPNTIIFMLLPFLAYSPRDAAKYAAWALGYSVVIAVASFLTVTSLYPAYTLSSFSHAVGLYYKHYVIGDWGLAYGSSFFGLAKSAVRFLPYDYNLSMINKAVAALWGTTLLLAVALFKYGRLGRRSIFFVLCAIYTLASSVFADYHLLVFFGVLLVYSDCGQVPWGSMAPADKAALLCAALMLAPKNYVFFHDWVSMQVLLNPIILAAGVFLSGRFVSRSSPPVLRPTVSVLVARTSDFDVNVFGCDRDAAGSRRCP